MINVPCKIIDYNKFNRKLENEYISKTFEIAIKLIEKKISYKLLNGPINKKKFLKKNFLGITEYISSFFKKTKTSMLIYNKKLSVSPITTHLPLKLVSKKISKELIIEKVRIADKFYKNVLKKKPFLDIFITTPLLIPVL